MGAASASLIHACLLFSSFVAPAFAHIDRAFSLRTLLKLRKRDLHCRVRTASSGEHRIKALERAVEIGLDATLHREGANAAHRVADNICELIGRNELRLRAELLLEV